MDRSGIKTGKGDICQSGEEVTDLRGIKSGTRDMGVKWRKCFSEPGTCTLLSHHHFERLE